MFNFFIIIVINEFIYINTLYIYIYILNAIQGNKSVGDIALALHLWLWHHTVCSLMVGVIVPTPREERFEQ